MDLVKDLELPSPILKTSIEDIRVKTARNFEGKFIITNIGSNFLEGDIISSYEKLTFSHSSFRGNKVVITYKVDIVGIKPEDILKTDFLIISNGGEKKLDVVVKVVASNLPNRFDVKIRSLEEFYSYAKENPSDAKVLFLSKDFFNWLTDIGYDKHELYEYFASDYNVDRGLDNFFIANNLKKEANIEIPNNRFSLRIEPNEKDITVHNVKVYLTGEGYIKSSIRVKNLSSWLHLETKDISILDFNNKDYKEIEFLINASFVKNKYVLDEIVFDDLDRSIFVEVIRKDPLKIYLSKTHFGLNDKGELIVENLSGKDIVIELFERDDFVRFEGKKYFVARHAIIPFEIKMSAFKTASSFFRKQPLIKSGVMVKAYLDDDIVRKNLDITIGTLI